MKLNLAFVAAVFGVLFATVKAQSINIGFPPDGTSVTPGSNLTVEIDRPDTLTGSIEVAVVIAVLSCSRFSFGCIPVDQGMGTVLYNGGYNPQFHSTAPIGKPPHQNFTVTIPSNIPAGKAQLGVAHITLIGALNAPTLETRNITLNVV
ncbi:hypothetical protein J132_05370 [Termitomyces sp. J132]|nr:hypothetical protein H2248_011058 [Termitomyces sp. 'cryptogamus']KNZ74971.1 hypothetical protein J132_05370 [Termitomyces sp. J132]